MKTQRYIVDFKIQGTSRLGAVYATTKEGAERRAVALNWSRYKGQATIKGVILSALNK